MKFIDFFAGVGGFRRGMELAGHECVGFCEFDKFATASYTSMHLLTQEQREFLDKMPLKQRQKEILKEEYRNGEWYANDIRRVYAGDIPKADCWCFGFPCQDISVAGKQLGFQGNRSSLFFRVMYLIGQLEEENRPTYLFIENVKNLLSVNGGWDFARLLIEMDHISESAQREIRKELGEETAEDRQQDSLDSFMKRMMDEENHTTEDYGWLEPDGTFHGVEWGAHQEWAQNYMSEKFPEEAMNGDIDLQTKCNVGLIGAGDWLVERGWVLLHNPSLGIAFPTKNPVKEYTKAQREFLYDYYMERDCKKEANAIWQEDE